MKMTYDELRTKSQILCSLTGLKVEEFEALLPSFAAAWEAFIQETFQREGRKPRLRAAIPLKVHLKFPSKLLYFKVRIIFKYKSLL